MTRVALQPEADLDEAAQQEAALLALQPEPLSREHGPLYRQLTMRLRAPIDTGKLAPGHPLPREADLAGRFGVSLITVRQALRDLEGEGLIKKRTAKPAIVATPPSRNKALEFQSLSAIAASTRAAFFSIGIRYQCNIRCPVWIILNCIYNTWNINFISFEIYYSV